MRIGLRLLAVCAGVMMAAGWGSVSSAAQQPTATQSAASATTIPDSDLIQADDLVKMLGSAEKPLVLQVGSHVLFAEAHIPGSEYVGATGTSDGLQALKERAEALKRDRLIVLYCGCCPWVRCPNIGVAYHQLRELGFTHLKVLYLADNFGKNWVDKGFAVESGR